MVKKAVTEVDWSEAEIDDLISTISTINKSTGQRRDSTDYSLQYNTETFSIDWDKIPTKYKKTFEALKDDLKIVKG